jgi:hypothetical protein
MIEQITNLKNTLDITLNSITGNTHDLPPDSFYLDLKKIVVAFPNGDITTKIINHCDSVLDESDKNHKNLIKTFLVNPNGLNFSIISKELQLINKKIHLKMLIKEGQLLVDNESIKEFNASELTKFIENSLLMLHFFDKTYYLVNKNDFRRPYSKDQVNILTNKFEEILEKIN